jgi:hypothetical protein
MITFRNLRSYYGRQAAPQVTTGPLVHSLMAEKALYDNLSEPQFPFDVVRFQPERGIYSQVYIATRHCARIFPSQNLCFTS